MIDANRILCPVDFSEHSARALTYAAKLSAWYGAKLLVVHVMPPLPPATTSALAGTARTLTERNLRAAIDAVRTPGLDADTALVESGDAAAIYQLHLPRMPFRYMRGETAQPLAQLDIRA